MMKNEIDLYRLYNKALNVLESVGIDTVRVNTIKLNGRLRRAYGRYNPTEKEIEISKKFFLNAKCDEHIVNVLIHEQLHHESMRRGDSHYNNVKHIGLWKNLADIVTQNTDYKIEQFISKEIHVDIASGYKYILKCECCGGKTGFKKRTKTIDAFLFDKHSVYCAKCGRDEGVLELIVL